MGRGMTSSTRWVTIGLVAEETENQSNDESVETEVEDSNASDASQDLDKDEQMALYEEALKNDDWGHQPC